MTSTYNRSQVYSANDLNEEQKAQVMNDYSFEDSDFYSTSYVKFEAKKRGAVFIPFNMFVRTNLWNVAPTNNFTHGIFSTSAFDGYYITFNRSNDECVIAHKYF